MPSIPRIVVVDASHDVARIVQGAMALLNRQCILVEVDSSSVSLVVTAYEIPGKMHGIELADHVCHESLETPVIVLAEPDDPHLDGQLLAKAPYQYFIRPVAEPFLRGLRFALDGEAAVADEVARAQPKSDLGPVPHVNVGELSSIIVDLMRDVGAMGIILADRTGRVLIDEGATGYIDRETLALLLGPTFARAADVGPLVGGQPWALHYYNGERLDVYGLSLGVHYLMCLIFEGSNRRAMASVMLYGRRTADQMIKMMGEAAFARWEAGPLPPPKARAKPAEPVPQAVEVEKLSEAEVEPAEAELALEEPGLDALLEPVIDFDAEALFDQSVDEGLAESMFSPDALSDLAASLISDEDERVGYDEAIDMGIIDE
jgi:hypothetical protein